MSQSAAMPLTTIAAHAVGPMEADWIRWAGLLLAVTGTLAAAPTGVVRLLHSPRSAYKTSMNWIAQATGMAALARMLVKLYGALGAFPFVPPRQADARSVARDEPTTDTQIEWHQNEPLKMKIERLHSGLVQAVEQISILRRAAESRDADLRAHLDQATGELRAATAALKLRMDTADLGAERTAARGVMLIGVGVILTSIPDGLARVAWIGWLAFAIALLLFGGVMLAVANELRAAASAHRTAQAPARPDWGSPGH